MLSEAEDESANQVKITERLSGKPLQGFIVLSKEYI